jgi:hypothetical protein
MIALEGQTRPRAQQSRKSITIIIKIFQHITAQFHDINIPKEYRENHELGV